MENKLLFDVSPEETSRKKKKGRKKAAPAAVVAEPAAEPAAAPDRFLVTSLDVVPCPQCGCPGDLVEVVKSKGSPRWLMQCGWWCLIEWIAEPVEGILESRPAAAACGDFVIPSGSHAGERISEIPPSHLKVYLNDRRTAVREAVTAWLDSQLT
jgi:hypothetical protein